MATRTGRGRTYMILASCSENTKKDQLDGSDERSSVTHDI